MRVECLRSIKVRGYLLISAWYKYVNGILIVMSVLPRESVCGVFPLIGSNSLEGHGASL
jgi:hypothetical protein